MRHLSSVLFAASVSLSFAACAIDDVDETDQAATGELGLHGKPEHIMLNKGEAHGKPGGGGSPNLTNHGGNVLTTNKTQAIFWGSEWSGASFQGDKVSGIDSLLGGLGGSSFANTNTEYNGASNGYVSTTSQYLGHTFDNSAAPSKALTVNGAVAEACKITGNNPDPNAVYFIYTSTHAGHVSYCAWHSAGTCSNGAKVQVAYMPNVDGEAGCDPGNPYGLSGSQGLRAVANVTAHEWSEAITDPQLNAWYDSSGQENADKCAWHWAGPVTLSNGSQWQLQMNWSNSAYTAGTTNDGVRGCIQTR